MANTITPEDFEREVENYRAQLQAGWITQEEYNERMKDAVIGIKGYTANLKASMDQLGNSFKSLGQDVYKGTQGVGVYSGVVESGADAVAAYTRRFGPAGQAIGLLTKAAAAYTTAALKQSDSLYDAFGKMNKVGTVGAYSMQETFAQMRNYGYNIEQLGNFTDLLARNSKNFGTFSKSALEGARQFGKVANSIQNSPIREQFFRLGMSVDDINDGIAGYVAQQGKLGRLQGKTTEELTAGSVEYIKQLDALTKLTGMSRQEQEDAREQALQVEAFYAGLSDLDPKAAEQALEAYTQALAKGGPKVAAEMAANFNGVVTGTSDLMLSTGGQSMKYFSKEFFARGGTADQAMAGVVGSISPSVMEVTKNLNQLGGSFGLNYRTINQLKGGVDPLAKTTKDLAAKQAAQLAGTDKTTAAQARIRDSELKNARNLQNFTQFGVEPATKALDLFQDVLEDIVDLVPGSDARVKKYREEKKQREEERKKQETQEPQQQKAPAAPKPAAATGAGKSSAESYLGRAISNEDYDLLVRATHAEAAGGKNASQQEQAMIMASILNRARTAKGGIQEVLYAKNQFQSVTGTKDNNRQPSQAFVQGPSGQRLESIESSAGLLGGISQKQKDFTASSSKAYGPGTDIGYRDRMLSKGGVVIGGTVFQTQPLSGPTDKYSSVTGPNDSIKLEQSLNQENKASQKVAEKDDLMITQIDRMDQMITLLKSQVSVSTRIMQSAS